ncbi:SDR family NAD(P)-dependent oxidoreductase [Nonomuraea dietziae]|uniref:3-oxoacyl-[acyl-carrier protein] reductase n=1 Tax=Nonomuraea dietziae TaxID=65515 RepID=A0A7W5VIZ6_9ACTN|nr:SDR family NAD(P)-dependent oxidoreductase [Nonomuraea dietziae]MBB3732853.1 hypothetical protein [Nonomuraea dietziae]
MTQPVHRRFEGQAVLVTGAASGIGRATALAFAREGAGVVVADVAAGQNEKTAQMIREEGGHALAVTCDVTSPQLVDQPVRVWPIAAPRTGNAMPSTRGFVRRPAVWGSSGRRAGGAGSRYSSIQPF